jgi:hypothetical protein
MRKFIQLSQRSLFCEISRKHFLHRNKIPLPVNYARLLFGIADETGILQPGQCFIQYRDLEFSPRSKTYYVVEGIILTLHNLTNQ